MAGSVTLRATLADGENPSMTFSGHALVVAGRASDCGLRLPADDTTASRHHFLLEINPPEVLLKDLGGASGTTVDGIRYGGRSKNPNAPRTQPGTVAIRLRDGASIRAGRNEIVVTVEHGARCPGCRATVTEAGPCRECRETLRPSEKPTGVQSSVSCSECGKRSTGDVGRRTDAWICTTCRTDIGSDPLQLREHPAPPIPSTDDVRTSVPGFDVVSRLGTGGMGAVYLARRIQDGMWAALKVLLARVVVDDASRMRFERESRLIEQLDHPNIVQFFDRGSDGALFFLAMELCGGGSVADLLELRGGRLSLHEAGPLIVQVLSALHYAHVKNLVVELDDGTRKRVRGLVHRDVKPANLLLAGSARRRICKLSDFGLAKSFEAAGLSGCTMSGQIGGTLRYMPPEQVTGFRHVTPAADLWGTGATLYEMLTGHDPRNLEQAENPFQAILDGRITPLRQHEKTVPDHVARVVERSLARAPEERFPDALTMQTEFLQALYGSDPMWTSNKPGSTNGTVLLPAGDDVASAPLALLFIGVGPAAAQRKSELEWVSHLTYVHGAITAQPASSRLDFLKCTGSGFLAACRSTEDAVAIARGVLMDGMDSRQRLRAATHHGRIQRTPEGNIVGVEVEWLLSLHDVDRRMRVSAVDTVDATTDATVDAERFEGMPGRRRSLLTTAAREHVGEHTSAGLSALGRYTLPRFGRPEALYADIL